MKYWIAKLALFSITILILQSANAQEIENLPNSPYGSAGDCTGKNLIINCFISEPDKEWLPEEKEAILAKQQIGIEWLKKQASYWGVSDLSFQTHNIGLKKDINVDKIEHVSNPARLKIHWATFTLHAAGYNNVYKLYDTLKKQYQVDNVVVMVFARKEGRSYAQRAFEAGVAYNKEWLLEGSVVYKSYWDSGKELCGGTIIHEMLHLYGAWDMYSSDLRSEEIQSKITYIFKNSVMIHDRNDDFKQFKVDQLTAWRIGWTKTYWPWYEMFRKDGEVKYWNTIPGTKQED